MNWNKKEIQFLVENYKKGNKKELKKILKRSWSAICAKGNRLGIKRVQPHKYNRNSSYFSNIDTPEKAYILGLIFGDGFVSKHKYYWGISLIDKDVIDFIKKSIIYSGPVTIDNSSTKRKYILRVCDKQHIEDLEHLGCVNNKSKILKFPNISSNLKLSFICGVFDADGSVYIPKKESTMPFSARRINFSGTEDMMTNIRDFLILYNFPNIKIKKDKYTYMLQYVSSRVEKFWEIIYSNSPYKMKRKEEKFKLDNEIVRALRKKGEYRVRR